MTNRMLSPTFDEAARSVAFALIVLAFLLLVAHALSACGAANVTLDHVSGTVAADYEGHGELHWSTEGAVGVDYEGSGELATALTAHIAVERRNWNIQIPITATARIFDRDGLAVVEFCFVPDSASVLPFRLVAETPCKTITFGE